MKQTRWAFSIVLALLLSLLSGIVGGMVIDADAGPREQVGISDHGGRHSITWVDISSPDGELLETMEVMVVGTAFDDFHVDSVMLSADGKNWVPATIILVWGDLHRGGAPEDAVGPQEVPMNGVHWSGRVTLSVGLNTIVAVATDQSGRSATDSVSVTVTSQAPSAPSQLLATTGEGQVRLTWRLPLDLGGSPITHYRIYRGTIPGSLSFLAEVGDVYAYTDPSVAEGVSYFYQVSATSEAGEGVPSNEVSARLPDITEPTIAIAMPDVGSVLTSVYVEVSGTASDNVDIARVELSVDGTKWVLAMGTTAWVGTLTLTEASNVIHARATDMEGNTATVTTAVTVETPQPGFQVSSSTAAFTALGIVAAIGAVSVLLLWRRARGGSKGRHP